jgi:surfeit locus 1 family protein
MLKYALLILAELLLISLGVWQLQRREWKLALIAAQEENLKSPPLTLQDAINNDLPNFQSVRLTGTPYYSKAVWVGRKTTTLGAGYVLVVPFLLNEQSPYNNHWLLVEAGFSPTKNIALPALMAPTSVVAYAMPRTTNWLARTFAPPNNPAKGEWLRLEPLHLASIQHLKPFLDVVLTAQEPMQLLTLPQLPPPSLRNEHLNYAIFWFSLAVALLVIIFLKKLKR